MFELANFQTLEILTRTPSSTSKLHLFHLHLGEEVHVEAMYSSSLHSGSSDDVALLVEHPSIFWTTWNTRWRRWWGRRRCLLWSRLRCRFVCTYSRIFHNFRVVSCGSHRTCKSVLVVLVDSYFVCQISHEFVECVRDSDPRLRSVVR